MTECWEIPGEPNGGEVGSLDNAEHSVLFAIRTHEAHMTPHTYFYSRPVFRQLNPFSGLNLDILRLMHRGLLFVRGRNIREWPTLPQLKLIASLSTG